MCDIAIIFSIILALGIKNDLWGDESLPDPGLERRPPASQAAMDVDAREQSKDRRAADEAVWRDDPWRPFAAPAPGVNEYHGFATIHPDYVRVLTPVAAGHNDANPVWSPDSRLIAFERAIGEKREIIIATRKGVIVRTIYHHLFRDKESVPLFYAGITDTASYNAGPTWSPDSRGLAFMSNAGSGNYDIFMLPDIRGSETVRLTRTPKKDSHPHWSPVGDRLLFVSGRTGKADIFTLKLADSRAEQLTRGPEMFLYPQWSPNGQRVLMVRGDNENHDIFMMDLKARAGEGLKALTTWTYDDLRPVWSPDGGKVAFYSNMNKHQDPKKWSIFVVSADGADPTDGADLAEQAVAGDVIPDIEQGPAWMPDSRHIVYVKDDEQAFNPIFLVDTQTGVSSLVRTDTKMNHDISCAADGTLAFRAQVEQWDHIHLSGLRPGSFINGTRH